MNNVFDFFVAVSLFECALKRAKLLIINEDDDRAMPNWDKFANSLDKEFFKKIVTLPNCSIIFEKPPKKQIRNGENIIDWCEVAPPKNNVELFLAVRRVRNNLFHGGKYVSGPIEEASRNQQLLSAGIAVLIEALKASSEDFSRAYATCAENRPKG